MPTLDWIGKKAVVNHHREVPYRLLRCDPKLSVGDPDAGNLLVQGDNLEALKALLPYYAGKVKCIYIDPPYNTGNENWVYNDNVNSPEILAWLGKTVGKEAEDLSRHDKWLCMMYPRLALLRDFLREDGVIFVSIDENEHRFLQLAMDEIFGPQNRIETFIWKKSYGGGAKSKHIVNLHEYVLCFARDKDLLSEWTLPPDERVLKYYKFRDEKYEKRGPYRLQPLATNSMDERPNLRYPIKYEGTEIWPEKQWQWSRERVNAAIANNDLVFRRKGTNWTVSYKQYLRDDGGAERGAKPYSIVEGIYTQQGTNEVKSLLGDGKAFSFPKPSDLVMHFLRLTTDKNSVVMDSFGGSGTTGHAVLKLNKEDEGSRRFLLIEVDEIICRNVTTKRIERAVHGLELSPALGGGFRFCTLGDPLFDERGAIRPGVNFAELAAHVFFIETGSPIPKPAKTPLLGAHEGRAVYLLFNGIIGDKRPQGGNVLTSDMLRALPAFDGPKVVYGEGCRLSDARLRRESVVFRHVPYQIGVR